MGGRRGAARSPRVHTGALLLQCVQERTAPRGRQVDSWTSSTTIVMLMATLQRTPATSLVVAGAGAVAVLLRTSSLPLLHRVFRRASHGGTLPDSSPTTARTAVTVAALWA